jgi:ribosomal protein S25
VAEVWSIEKPKKDSGLSTDQRVITIGKSRIGRSGESLIQTQNDDLTVSLVEAKKPEEMQTRAGTVAERIMNRLQTSKHPMSSSDLKSDPLVGGSVAAIRKTLQRLENRGVVHVTKRSTPTGPVNLYSALRAWGESAGVRQGGENPDDHSKGGWDTGTKNEECPTPSAGGWDNEPQKPECPTPPLSAGAGSDTVGTPDVYPRAGEKRSPEELRALNNASWNEFDL